MPQNEDDVDALIIDAHRCGDNAALVTLCAHAADRAEADGDPDAADFFLTQAYVYALEAGDKRAGDLNARLKARGREE